MLKRKLSEEYSESMDSQESIVSDDDEEQCEEEEDFSGKSCSAGTPTSQFEESPRMECEMPIPIKKEKKISKKKAKKAFSPLATKY